MILNPYNYAQAYDELAAAYFAYMAGTASSPLSSGDKTAVNNLVRRMKGLDSNYANFGSDAIYQAALGFQVCPNLGSNLNGTKVNLMAPGSRTPTYNGGITLDAGYGPRMGAVNGYITSGITLLGEADLNKSSGCIGMVLKGNLSRFDFGTYGTNFNGTNNGDSSLWMRGGTGTTTQARTYRYESNSSAAANCAGHNAINLNVANTGKIYRNKTLLFTNNGGTATNDYTENDGNIPFGSVNVNGSNQNLGNDHTIMMTYIFRGLSDANMDVWNNIVEDFMTETNRKTW